MTKIQCKSCSVEIAYDETQLLVMGGRTYFAPTLCDACGETQKRERDEKDKLEKIAATERAWAEVCPPLYQKTDVARLPASAKAVLDWNLNPKGLVVLGPSGRGKTRAVWVLLKRIFMEGHSIRSYTACDFGRASSDCSYSGAASEWAASLIRCGVLFIDDLGKSKITERNESDLFDICEQRISHERPIIITTNATGDELARRFDLERGIGGPLVRRLREFCDAVVF